MSDWIHAHEGWLWALTAGSLALLILSLLLTPWLLVRMPADAFALRQRRPSWLAGRHPALRMVGWLIRNVLGSMLLLAGMVMVVTPGPGLVTLLAGFVLLDFPWKYRIERWLMSRPLVLGGINALRRRAGQPPLQGLGVQTPHRLGRSPDFVEGNQVQVLERGAAFFPALLALIASAQREIHLHTYIFAADATGRAVTAALAAAARRDVAVRILVDGYGSPDFQTHCAGELAAAGVRFMVYHPCHWLRFSPSRLHRKVVVVDGRVALVGGINIEDDDPRRPGHAPWRQDYAVRIEGPLVAEIRLESSRLWNRTAMTHLRRRWRVPLEREVAAVAGNMAAAWVVRDNVRHRRTIEKTYLWAIREAKQDIQLAHAYFLPGRRLRRTLMDAAKRGVRVTVLVQGRTEYAVGRHASEYLYPDLLRAGVRMHAYQPTFLHAKVAVIDGQWATVGSSNLDPLSLLLAQEANVWVKDTAFAGDLRGRLLGLLETDAVEITCADAAAWPWHRRMRQSLAWASIRFLVGWVA